jgi:hypothetical protein
VTAPFQARLRFFAGVFPFSGSFTRSSDTFWSSLSVRMPTRSGGKSLGYFADKALAAKAVLEAPEKKGVRNEPIMDRRKLTACDGEAKGLFPSRIGYSS